MHFYSVKNRPKIPIFSTFINNEILRNFEWKNHCLVHGILEEFLYLRKAQRGRGWEGEGEPLPHPSFSHLFAPSPQSATQSERLEQTCLLTKHVHGHNYARGTNRTAIRSWLKTNILATCNDCMFNKELDRFMPSFSRKRQNRASETQALAAGCKEVGTVWNGISLGFWELFAHPNI